MGLYELAELISSAKINFENVENLNPMLSKHPIYMIAKTQLDEAETSIESMLNGNAETPPQTMNQDGE